MNCRWCSNFNFLPGSTCAHCGEHLSGRPGNEERKDRATNPADEERRALYEARFKSVVVSIAAIGVMTFGSVSTYHHWPVTVPPPPPLPSVSPSESPTPSGDPNSQLSDVDTLLQSIKQTRSEIPDTLGSCSNAGSDLPTLEQAVQERTDQVSQAANLPLDAVSDGEALKESLSAMVNATLTADQKYVTWAKHAQSSGRCTDVPADGAIGDANQVAADAKRAFVALWNSDAGSFDLSTYEWNDF